MQMDLQKLLECSMFPETEDKEEFTKTNKSGSYFIFKTDF